MADFALGQVPIADHRVSRDGTVTLTAGLDNGSYLRTSGRPEKSDETAHDGDGQSTEGPVAAGKQVYEATERG